MTLGLLQYEVFHVCSLRVVAPGVSFAPVGLLDMFNAGGAVKECAVTSDVGGRAVSVRVRVCGRFGAYYSREPARCLMDSAEVELVMTPTPAEAFNLPVLEQELYQWTLEIVV